MCQSAGCSAIRSANAVREQLRPAPHLFGQARAGQLDRRPDPLAPAAVIGEPEAHRQQRRPRLGREQRRPARHLRRLAEELDLDAVAGEIALGDEAHHAARAQPRREHIGGGLCPPVSGSTSMPRLSRYSTNRSNSDSGLSRSATVVNGWPCATSQIAAASQLPVCGRATITPLPACAPAARCSAPVVLAPARSATACLSILGSRNVSSQ